MSASPSIMIIAGEDSADQYAGRLVAELRRRLPELSFFGIGGKRMLDAGVELLYTTDQTSIMGFGEVIANLGLVRRMFRDCVHALKARIPKAVVLIDYPGFNLRFARKVKAEGIPVVYYIAPQVWAWGKDRAKKMQALVDEMAVVFPFEEEIFSKEGIPTTFVGHPLLEILEHVERQTFVNEHKLADRRILALLPGSRKQEIQRMLPPMLRAAKLLGDEFEIEIAIGASGLPDGIYNIHLQNYPKVHLLHSATHALMEHAHAALVTSGTATVETAFYETPMAVGYKTSSFNYAIGKRLINVDNIAMVNILAGRTIVPELVQHQLTAHALADAIRPCFTDMDYYRTQVDALRKIKDKMGSVGTTSRVADIVIKYTG